MGKIYSYELWNGKKSVGQYISHFPLLGYWLVVPEVSVLKHRYYRKIQEIKVPIRHRIIMDDGIDYVVRKYLDVRKKSKRQIEILKGYK